MRTPSRASVTSSTAFGSLGSLIRLNLGDGARAGDVGSGRGGNCGQPLWTTAPVVHTSV